MGEKTEQVTGKRTLTEGQEESANNSKKQKKNESNTIPILRGKFKQRWLVKHSSLIKRSDDVTGIMVSCNVNAETRALGQISHCLEKYIDLLYPKHESTWSRFEGDFDVAEIDEDDKPLKEKDPSRKDKKFQAVDAACGGLVFYRFRVNVKPTDFIIALMDYLKKLPKNECDVVLRRLNHCARWIPLDYVCPAVTERISLCFERVKADYFDDNNELNEDTTVAIITEIRNNIMISKEEIIQTIAPMIPSKYKINLKKPTLVIFVTIFKSACGISVLKEYYDRKKYNIGAYCRS